MKSTRPFSTTPIHCSETRRARISATSSGASSISHRRRSASVQPMPDLARPTTPTSLTFAAPPIAFDEALIRKHDGRGPRYTSYPTADRFHEQFTAGRYVDALASRVASAPLSLYVHVPFCDTICYYCACNKIITRNHEHSGKYIRHVTREIEIVAGFVE